MNSTEFAQEKTYIYNQLFIRILNLYVILKFDWELTQILAGYNPTP